MSKEEKEVRSRGSIEEKIIAAAINSLTAKESLEVALDVFSYFSSESQSLLKVYERIKNQKSLDNPFQHFLQEFSEEKQRWIIELCMEQIATPVDVFKQLLVRFRKYHWKRIIKDLKLRILRAKQERDDKQLQILLAEFSRLKDGVHNQGLI